jgi:hypothetical protein
MRSIERENCIDEEAKRAIDKMSTRDMGNLIYPDSTPVALNEVPREIVDDNLQRYRERTKARAVLQGGQKFTFSMDK